MNGTDVILRWAQRLGPNPVVLAASAAALTGRLGECATVTAADRSGAAPSVCVHVIALGAETEISSVLSGAADRDVIVLLLRLAPTAIPLGRLIADATDAGMRILEAGGSADGLGRTTIVLSRDPALPRRPTALDADLGSTPELELRLSNERQPREGRGCAGRDDGRWAAARCSHGRRLGAREPGQRCAQGRGSDRSAAASVTCWARRHPRWR